MIARMVVLLLTVLFAGSIHAAEPAATPAKVTDLKGPELEQLIHGLEGHSDSWDGFSAFLRDALPLLEEPPASALRYLTGRREFDPDHDAELFRLFGVYVRMAKEPEVMALLEKLVAIPTYRKPDVAPEQSPEIIRLGRALEEAGKKLNLPFRNLEDHVYEFTLPPADLADKTPAQIPADRLLGVYTHGDVVPANPARWVLEDGRKLEPYQVTVIGDRIYGRGTEDDKCSVVAALAVMEAARDAGFKLKRGIRLLVETTEETGGEGFDYYKAHGGGLAPYNVVLDGGYPLVIAEKGWGQIDAEFAAPATGHDGDAEILDISGGTAVNQIPEASIAHVRVDDPKALVELVKKEAPAFVQANPGAKIKDFKIDAEIEEATVRLTVTGTSAHSSAPEDGVNPLSRMLSFLMVLSKKTAFVDNGWFKAARFADENFGTDDLAKKLGVDYSDDFMGPLTASITFIEKKAAKKPASTRGPAAETPAAEAAAAEVVHLAVNLRPPRGKTAEELKKAIEDKLAEYKKKKDSVKGDFEVSVDPWMYRDPKGPWTATLLDTFANVTGLPAKPTSDAGSTTAKQLPNGLNFGPSMPGEVYTGHTEKEFKLRINFMHDLQMYAEALTRLALLEKME